MKRPGQGPAGARGGTTLVEVIIGCLILSILKKPLKDGEDK